VLKVKLSPGAFGFALLCFFLPFVTVSCQRQKVMSFTGVELVMGTTINQPQMFGPSKVERVDPEPLAILAFLAGLAGLGLSFLKTQKSAVAPAIVAGAGAVCLLLLKSKFDSQILGKSGGMLQVDYDVGFWLVLVLYLAAVAMNGFVFVETIKGPEEQTAAVEVALSSAAGPRTPETGSTPVASEVVESRFCSQCGKPIELRSKFCAECGASVS